MKDRYSLWTLVLFAAVFIAYANSLQNGFHFDDFHTVVNNPYIRSLHNIPRFFSDATTFSVLPANRTYRPFVSTTLAIDYALGGGYKLIWFHIGTLLVFFLQLFAMQHIFTAIFKKMENTPEPYILALFATAWYGLHPAMAETVNYIIQRGDVYSAFGVTAALAIYIRWPNYRYTGIYLLPFAFALLSKPTAVVFPVLLFAYICYFERSSNRPLRSALLKALPSVGVCAILMWLQAAMTPKSYTPSTLSNLDYCITQPFVLLRYFGSFVLPIHLNVDTDLSPFTNISPLALVGFLFLLLLIAAIVLTARSSALYPISFGLLWFLVTSLPTSVYGLSEVENDHRMFMPFIGLVVAGTWTVYLCVSKLVARWPNRPMLRYAAAIATVALAAYGYGVHQRNNAWHTEESLWFDDVQKSPRNGRGLMIYGLTQMEQGRYAVALDYFQRALAYTPNYPTLEINLGVVNGATGATKSAEEHFLRAINLAPASDETHLYYGRWLIQIGRLAEAISQLQRAFELNPSQLTTRDLLMNAFATTGQIDRATSLAQQTIALFPTDEAAQSFLQNPLQPTSHYWLDVSLYRYQQHDFQGSIEAAQQTLKLEPRSERAYNNIGAAYAAMGKWDLAIENEKQALAINPDFVLAKNNMAWALSEKKKLP